ncbi:MAG TPA: MFS transporter [Acidimicrobiales bacterium]|nr:MFS transporter [Acidimicrobiales bacterium]
MRGSLRSNRDFVRLWIGQSISQVGSQVTLLALPLIAIRVLHAGAFELGVLAAAETAPFLLIGLPAGVWVDQWRRRSVLIVADIGRALVLATVPVAYAFDALTMGHLFMVAVATGALTVFFDVAYQSYLPTLVSPDQLVEGNSRLELSRSAAQVAGPGLAGVLVQLVRGPMAIAVDSVSFGVSALFVARIRTPEPKPSDGGEAGATMGSRIAEGLRYVLRHPLLSRIAATTSLFNFFSAVGMAVFLLYAVRRLRIDPAVVGVIFSVGSLGFVLGSMIAGRTTRALGVGPALAVAGAVQGAAFLLVPLAPERVAVAFFVAAFILEAVAAPVYGITQVSLRQTITPARMQGRTNATMRFLVWGALPLGSIVGGVLGDVIGLRSTLWVAAVGTTLSVLPLLGRSLLGVRAMPEAQPDD